MNLEILKNELKQIDKRYEKRDYIAFGDAFNKLKKRAIKAGNEELANEIWHYEQVANIHNAYIAAYEQLKAYSFYRAWCSLARVEIDCTSLERHLIDPNDTYKIKMILNVVRQYQSLYPYKVFLSPELIKLEKVCNICNKPVSPRKHCGHRVGRIYWGQLCMRIVTKVEIPSISIVINPVQKYSVVFLEGEDHYDYRPVKYVVDKLASPFHPWEASWTQKYHPHSLFSNYLTDDPCPCGSNKPYEACCLLNKKGILRPHCQITFSVAPNEEPRVEYYY